MEDSSCFFKIIFSKDIQELMIPRAFANKYRSTLSSHAYLRARGGAEHQVELTRHDGDDWFSNGWKDFADQYSLKLGYFIVFRYNGDSRFHVLIFDPSCSEIEYPNIDVRSSDDEEVEDLQGKFDAREKAEEVALTLRNPSFIVSMRESYLRGPDIRMWVPLAYARRHLEGVKAVQVQVATSSDKTWSMKVTTRSQSTRFASGWKGFVSDNQLEGGDVCVFELIDTSNLTYLVRIFRGAS